MISQNTETMKRDVGDYKSCSMNITSRSQSINCQSDISNSNMDKTLSLSIQSQDQMDLNLEDIISLYEHIDNHIFDNKKNYDIIASEKAFYSNINQIENQRILLQVNRQSTICSGFVSNTRQLIIQKLIQVDCQEIMIQKLDEYKIHYVINKQYPQQSLQLITPVCIKKHQQKYQQLAIMEKASFNLYDYSRKYDITSEQAYYIFITILQQIKSLHQLKIAHRDVKPQNILYVQDKGWVLSDFGESQEYNDIESYYNIRGTKYFLPYSIQQQISKSIKIQQNLLKNDLYALVVSIIIIQKKDHLLNIEQEIKNLELGNYLQTVLSFKSLEQLIIFYDNLPKIQNNVEFQTTQSIYKIMTPFEKASNIIATQMSWIDLYRFYSDNQINLELCEQILELVNQKQQRYQPITFGLNQYNRGKNTNPLVFAKKMKKKDYSLCNFLFLSGYNEMTILYAKQSLLNSYNQKTQMILILAYQRSLMFEEASQEINLFIQGLKFDQLENVLHQQFLLLIDDQSYFNFNQFNFKFNLNELFNKQNIQKQNALTKLKTIISEYNNQLSNKNIDELFSLIEQICKAFTPTNLGVYSNIMYQIQISLSIDIYKMIVKKVILKNFQLIDLNRKAILIYDLGQTEFFLNQENLIQSAKQFQYLILISESKEQIITFQIIRLALKVFQFQANFNQYLNKIRFLIKNINPISFGLYQQYVVVIINNLIYTVNQFYRNQKSCHLIYLVQYCIPQAYNEQYLKEKQSDFISIHTLGLQILFDQQNYRRCLKLEKDYQQIGLIVNQGFLYKYKQFKNKKWDALFSSPQGRSRQFLFWKYLNIQ